MMLSVFLVFLVGSARSLKTPISQANTKARQSGQKKQIVKGSAGTCAIFSLSISQKRHGHWTPKKFGDFGLNQPVLYRCVDAGQQLIRPFSDVQPLISFLSVQQSQPVSDGSSISSTSFRRKLDNRSGVQPFTSDVVITVQRQVAIADVMFPQSTET